MSDRKDLSSTISQSKIGISP